MSEENTTTDFVALTADIVSAYTATNFMPAQELADLIATVHATLVKLADPAPVKMPEAPKPAVPVRRSVTPDYIVCLEDGQVFKSLKRHLRTRYGMTPEEYRRKWGLPDDYPMVAPNYARARSELAKEMGLGQQRRRRPPRR